MEIREDREPVCRSCGATFAAPWTTADSSITCHQCGFDNKLQASSCSRCGAALAKHCPQCGARLELEMRFCDQCGANYARVSSPDGHCEWCGFQNAQEARLCEKCGARLAIVCPNCEAEMKAGVNYCKACGLDYSTLLETEDEES